MKAQYKTKYEKHIMAKENKASWREMKKGNNGVSAKASMAKMAKMAASMAANQCRKHQ
jgi:hypothetical protein